MYLAASNISFLDKLQALSILTCMGGALLLRWDFHEDYLPYEMLNYVLHAGTSK